MVALAEVALAARVRVPVRAVVERVVQAQVGLEVVVRAAVAVPVRVVVDRVVVDRVGLVQELVVVALAARVRVSVRAVPALGGLVQVALVQAVADRVAQELVAVVLARAVVLAQVGAALVLAAVQVLVARALEPAGPLEPAAQKPVEAAQARVWPVLQALQAPPPRQLVPRQAVSETLSELWGQGASLEVAPGGVPLVTRRVAVARPVHVSHVRITLYGGPSRRRQPRLLPKRHAPPHRMQLPDQRKVQVAPLKPQDRHRRQRMRRRWLRIRPVWARHLSRSRVRFSH